MEDEVWVAGVCLFRFTVVREATGRVSTHFVSQIQDISARKDGPRFDMRKANCNGIIADLLVCRVSCTRASPQEGECSLTWGQ